VYLTQASEVQPDAFLFYDPPPPGGGRLTTDGYLDGPPQLVFEVAASSASYDLHDKKEAYRLAGVPEYIVWRTLDKQINWFRLRNGEYELVEPDANGVIESALFPGLRLAVAKMLAGDLAGVLAELERPDSAAGGR
jgi:Uma2 family endonuclease